MNKFIKIFDNSINFNLADKIEEQLTDIHFPYNYLQNVTYGNSSNTYKPGFLHEFFDFENKINNVYTSFLNQILYSFCFTQQINILHYFKGRVFMHIPSLNQDKDIIHVDTITPHWVCLYYVCDSDGDTILYKDDYKTELKRITPKKNRIVFFEGSIPHCSTPPSNNHRIIINFNFIGEKL
jgi:hypothetical protein